MFSKGKYCIFCEARMVSQLPFVLFSVFKPKKYLEFPVLS